MEVDRCELVLRRLCADMGISLWVGVYVDTGRCGEPRFVNSKREADLRIGF